MTDQNPLTRRTFLKGAFAAIAAASTGSALAACAAPAEQAEAETGQQDGRQPAADQAQQGTQQVEGASGEGVPSDVLVAFFSATGNTRGVAEAIAAHLGADTFEITPVEPYTEEDLGYNNSNSRTSQEREDPNRHVELEQVTPEGFDGYDTVFVGYPIWWGDAAWVVDDFITQNSFEGKRVIPFCTSGSSPIGSSGQNLADLAGAGDWLPGARFAAGASEAEVAAWVDGLGL